MLQMLLPAGEAQLAFDKSEFVLLMPYTSTNQYRIIGIVRDERAEHPENLTFEDVGHEAIDNLHINIEKVNWFSTCRVHHRITDHFRSGRAFLLGDAAHVHSPTGSQGMNTGIMHAINLAWKLTVVLKGQAPDSLLDSYEQERQAFARKLVETTDRLFTFATAEGGFADFVRNRIAPIFISVAYKIENVREYMFRIVSQTTLSYHESPLSSGKAGSVQGADNYESLKQICWQVHIYGDAKPDLKAWCDQKNIPLHVFAWGDLHHKGDLERDAVYLLRPDNYVALADPLGSMEVLDQYFKAREISLNI